MVSTLDFSSPTLAATRARLVARFGARVEPWWEHLPATLGDLTARWELALGDAVGRGSTSLVIRCQRADGRDAMLKLTPDAELGRLEAYALRAWQPSRRVPELWGYDSLSAALLMEAIPGEASVADTGAEVGVLEIAEVISGLHRWTEPSVAPGAPTLAGRDAFVFDHWIARHGTNQRIPRAVVARLEHDQEQARALARRGGTQSPPHGDLHPADVLHGGASRGLVAIDPRPCVGDAAFDAIDWVFWGEPEPSAWNARSCALASALELDEERLWSWCIAFAGMLAANRVLRGEPPTIVEALLALTR